jgi:hypothetical protein
MLFVSLFSQLLSKQILCGLWPLYGITAIQLRILEAYDFFLQLKGPCELNRLQIHRCH